ncbi:hypothetical protein [Pseudomonas lactucae]|uniref:hypothetical protein n=1 Tax=Pseudomonas lactucae TaxID=2813360 RepID=UPI001CEDD1A5|nr:hypothetical protein [Pseudomonas lactucae]
MRDAVFRVEERAPLMYLSMFSRTHRNLCAIGYLDQNSSAFKTFDTQALTLAAYFRAQLEGSATALQFEQLIQRDEPDLSGGIQFVKSDRHAVYLDARAFLAYLEKLRADLNWPALGEHTYDALKQSSRQAMTTPQPAPVLQEVSVHGE